MASSTLQAGQKRKVGADKSVKSSNTRKRQKIHDARAIPIQRPDAAVSATGDLNISSFIKAREFEIGALEKSMQKARKSLSARAFQQVPRHMRRRTASHNAKKVPRRLRGRAEREMKEDNTPTVTKRKRTPSRKLRLRLDTARTLTKLNQKRQTVRQKKKEAKANTQRPDPEAHVLTSRVPRLKKNTLAKAPSAITKYKRRQVNKTWLPTHLWHTKRAHMTQPTEPLWRLAIPLSPTEKSYRPSHRAAGTQGCISWDMSYVSTVACWGTETALDSLLKAFGFSAPGLSPTMLKKWKAGTRFATGWVSERDGQKRPIAPVTVIWFPRKQQEVVKGPRLTEAEGGKDSDQHAQPAAVLENSVEAENAEKVHVSEEQGRLDGADQLHAAKQKPKLDHRILIRIYPSAFHQFWQDLLKVAKMQKPQVLVEDLRFEVGSIEIQGPGSTEALLGVLCPFPAEDEAGDSNASSWTSLAGLSNPSILPRNAMLSFDIIDPRLNHPPKPIQIPKDSESGYRDELVVSWPPDKSFQTSPLLSHKQRWLVSTSLPSQKAINRRRALAPPGQNPIVAPKDPRIPVILLASSAAASNSKNSQGTWTVLLPWNAVDPVWRSLMYYPLSSGGTPRFGGMNEKQQMAFECRSPWFPGDLPGTEAGKKWERTENEKRFDAWIRRPPKHRIAWDMLDLGMGRSGELGRGWACDWEYLLTDSKNVVSVRGNAESTAGNEEPTQDNAPRLLTQRQRKTAKARAAEESEKRARQRNTSSPESEAEPETTPTVMSDVKYIQLSPDQSLSLLKNPSPTLPHFPALVTIRITLLDKGTPSAAARIYRLPSMPKTMTKASPGQSLATGQGVSQESEPQSWPSDGPPPGQPVPSLSTADSSGPVSTSTLQTRDLRARWLAMDTLSTSKKPVQKIKTNRSGVPRHEAAYPLESLAKINVLPKNAPAEIVEKWGANSAFGKGNGEIPKQKPPPPNDGKHRRSKGGTSALGKLPPLEKKTQKPNFLDQSAPGVEEMKDLLINPFGQPTEWDKHPPCPGHHDLIGFITSGGYNLAEGRGTATGGIWIQRLLQGWEIEEDEGVTVREKERRRRLCIVRNAGESVGRLATWETC